MKFIVGISGKQYAGKDTVANHLLSEYLAEHGFVKRSIADTLKLEYYDERFGANKYGNARRIARVNRLKMFDPAVRTALIELGRRKREEDPLCLVKRIMDDPAPFIIVPDMRFRNEYEYFLANADGFYSIRVNCPEEDRAARGVISNANDPTETDLDYSVHSVTYINTNNERLSRMPYKITASEILCLLGNTYIGKARELHGYSKWTS